MSSALVIVGIVAAVAVAVLIIGELIRRLFQSTDLEDLGAATMRVSLPFFLLLFFWIKNPL